MRPPNARRPPSAAAARRLTRTRRRWLIAGTLLAALPRHRLVRARRGAAHQRCAPTRIAIDATPIEILRQRATRRARASARSNSAAGWRSPRATRAFGGLSAIHVEPDGAHFLSLTDNGSWLRGRIVYRDGRPAGIADAEMAPMLGPDGKPLAARRWFDTESLTELDGLLYVGIERVNEIVRFDVRRDGLRGARHADPGAARFQDFHLQQEPGMPGRAGPTGTAVPAR